jgi:pimeloyl-ACP methyl ester carboxylesterase
MPVMTSARPVVLVHGAFHGAWCWAALQTELDRLGVPSYAIDLPGHGASTEPLEDLHGDAAAVARLLEALDDDVVLVGHSYGGAVIGQAGLAGRVHRLVFLSALVVDVGESPTGIAMSLPADGSGIGGVMRRDEQGRMSPVVEAARDVFYNMCSPATVAAATARLRPQRAATMKQPASVAAWHERPCTYVRCLQDRALTPAMQDLMAARCHADVLDIDADHSPFICAPAQLAALLAPLTAR